LTFLFCSKQQAADRSQADERVPFLDRAQVADEALVADEAQVDEESVQLRDMDDGVGFRSSAAARFADRQGEVSQLLHFCDTPECVF
jgi:hypothetical protein